MNPGRLETVAVVGNGIIGHGIAQIFAVAGKSVVMIGRKQEFIGPRHEEDCRQP